MRVTLVAETTPDISVFGTRKVEIDPDRVVGVKASDNPASPWTRIKFKGGGEWKVKESVEWLKEQAKNVRTVP